MRKIWKCAVFVALFCSASTGHSSTLPIRLTSNNTKAQRLPNPPKDEPEPNLDGVVEVSFKIDNEGRVEILTINSTSPQLADYVIRKLGKVKLEQGSSQTGKVIKYSFVFKKQA